MMYDFDNWRANMVLEALQALDEKWTAIRDAAADYGNDMMRLSILREALKRRPLKRSAPTSLSCQANLTRR